MPLDLSQPGAKILASPTSKVVEFAAGKGSHTFFQQEIKRQLAKGVASRAGAWAAASLEPTPLAEMLLGLELATHVFNHFDNVEFDVEVETAMETMMERVRTGTDTKPQVRRRQVCGAVNIFVRNGVLWKGAMPEVFARFGDDASDRVEWALGITESRIEKRWKKVMVEMMEKVVKLVDENTHVATRAPGSVRTRGRQRERNWSKP